MTYSHLDIEQHDHVAVVRLNRPEASNALSLDLMAEIEAAADAFKADLDTRVVVFTGAGEHFSVGIDLKDPRQIETFGSELLARQRRFHAGPRMIRKLLDIDQITIAAVNGLALGGAACLATALDFRIGAHDCRIGYPEVNLGMPLAWISLPLCVHLIGPARAKKMVILGEPIPADALREWGFLDEVAAPDQLLDRAMTMAAAFAQKAPIAAQMIKRSVNAVVAALDRAVMHMDSDQVLLAQSSEDFKEGVAAFFQKRAPDFKGR